MSKRILSIVLVFVMFFSALYIPASKVVAVDLNGVPNILDYSSNTSSKKFVVTSYKGMTAFSDLAGTSNFKGVTVYLGNDIDMAGGVFVPFKSFAGTFDGQGYALKSININASGDSAGVFGTVTSTGTVKNLGIEGGNIRLASSSDSHRVGSIAGVLNGGTIERCYSTATLTITKAGTTTDLSVGGIAGGNLNNGLIKDCYFAGVANGIDHASGICDWGQGHNEGAVGRLVNCYSIGELNADAGYGLCRYSASILESNKANAITNCYYLSKYNGLDFTTNDKTIAADALRNGKLAYLLDGGATVSTRGRVWHQGELFPELSGDTAIGNYKLSLTVVAAGTSTSATVYKNAGSTYAVDEIAVTLSSAGNVENNVFTMPAADASLTVTTDIPNITKYTNNATSTKFVITNAAGFTNLATVVNASTDTFSGDSIYMLCDISMSSVSHTPIGIYDSTYAKSFQGTFYGLGNRVHGLNVNQTALDGAGLFGCMYKAKIYDFGVSSGTVAAANRVGGIAGYADSCRFYRCYNGATVTSLTGEDGCGGLAGVARSTTYFTNCFNIGNVIATVNCAGGLTGWGQKSVVIKNCFNMGTISAGGYNTEGLTRYNGSLDTEPVAAYFLTEASYSTKGESKSRTDFANGSVAWLLNTTGGTKANSKRFTSTPLCPALARPELIGSSPAIKATINTVDSDGNTLSSSSVFCNGGDMIAPSAPLAGSFANQGVIAPDNDGEVSLTMNIDTPQYYTISTAAELSAFATAVNGGNSYSGCYVSLEADIDMSSYTCAPIGTENAPFEGIFDGKGHTVTGYNLSSTSKYVAMFGVIKSATVKNLYLGDSAITGGYYAGSIVGYNMGGTVTNCGTNAAVTVSYNEAVQELSVMSFNVRVSGDATPNTLSERSPRVKQHIASYSPDIIGFQEVVPAWKTNFDSWLSAYSSEFVWRDTANNEAAPLYWKTSKFTCLEQGSFWLSETPDEMSIGWTAACYRTCSYAALVHKDTGILVLAFNTHLDHKSSEARTKGARLIVSRMKKMEQKYRELGYGNNIAMFCTGDYNCGTSTAAYEAMLEGFADLRTDANTKVSSETQATFHGYGSSSSLIDYIFTNNRGCESLSYKVNAEKYNGNYISDHYALYGIFALNYMHAGGLVGYNSGLVSDCYTTGTLTGGMNTGGLVGYNTGCVQNSYCGTTVQSTDYMGGVIGVNKGDCTNCYYVGSDTYNVYLDTSLTTGAKTVAEMQTEDFAAALTDTSKWWVTADVNGAYPYPTPLFGQYRLVIKADSALARDEGDQLYNVVIGTKAGELMGNFDNLGVVIYDLSNKALSDNGLVGTGFKVCLISNGRITDSVTVVVRGDLDGDAAINSTDYLVMKKALTASTTLLEPYKSAADVNGDNAFNSADRLSLKTKIN